MERLLKQPTRVSRNSGTNAKKLALAPLRTAAKLLDGLGDHMRKDSYDPNSPRPDGRRERIKFERMLGNFAKGGKFKDPKDKVKGKGKARGDGPIIRQGRTRGTQR